MEESKKRPAPNDNHESQPPAKRPTVYREPSIFGHKPVDDITKYIADFIAKYVTIENVEVV